MAEIVVPLPPYEFVVLTGTSLPLPLPLRWGCPRTKYRDCFKLWLADRKL